MRRIVRSTMRESWTPSRRAWIAGVGASLLLTRLRYAAGRDGDAHRPSPEVSKPLSVGVALVWKSERVANALGKNAASEYHVLANEAVDQLAITAVLGDRRFALGHDAKLQPRFWDPARHLYATTALRATELEALLARRGEATFTLDLGFTFLTFFDVLLEQMTRTDQGLHNLANPEDSAAILSTFDHEIIDDKVDITYHSQRHTIRGVPCKLVDIRVNQAARAPMPAVELGFEIDFFAGIDAARRVAMRKLVAMDWSALAGFDDDAVSPPAHASVWRDNVLRFLSNQTDMERAERLRMSIAARHARKRPRRLADDVRRDIDLHLVTANRWNELREDLDTERHQALLSSLLEALYPRPASPTRLSRELMRRFQLTLDEQAAMTLQYGIGNCGEHGRVAFSILSAVMAIPGNHLDSIVLCGNANIDHAFVLCNLKVTRVLLTTATNAENTRVRVGQDIKVFNLRDALAETSGESFVVDPYLDRSMTSRTGERLLRALNSRRKQDRGKDTDFLRFDRQYPVPADFSIEDIRDRSVADRMRLVKNV